VDGGGGNAALLAKLTVRELVVDEVDAAVFAKGGGGRLLIDGWEWPLGWRFSRYLSCRRESRRVASFFNSSRVSGLGERTISS